MWEPLQGLLSSPSDDIKVQALWVIGTAVQNNPAAQKAVRSAPREATAFALLNLTCFLSSRDKPQYLALDPLPAVTSCLSTSAQSSQKQQLRAKAIYALSGLLKHNAAATASFDTAGGWDALRSALSGTMFLSIRPSLSPISSKALILRAQTQTSPFGARRRFSSTASSHPLSPFLPPRRRLLRAREYTGAATTPQWERLYTQTRTRRWWPTPRRSTRHPRRCAPCARTNCYPC